MTRFKALPLLVGERALATAATTAAELVLIATIYQRSGSTIWLVATVSISLGLPGLLDPFAGVVADRFNRKKIIAVCHLITIATLTTMAFLSTPTELIISAAVLAVVGRPSLAAFNAAVPNMVAAGRLGSANSWLGAAGSVGSVAGPVGGGLIGGITNPSLLFGLAAGLDTAALALLLLVQAPFGRQGIDGDEPSDLRAAVRIVKANRALLLVALLVSFGYLATNVTAVADPPMAQLFGKGVAGYGLMEGVWHSTSIVVYLMLTRLRDGNWNRFLALGAFVAAIGYSVVSGAGIFPMVLVGAAIAALADALADTATTTLIQGACPDRVRAKVFGLISAVGLVASNLAYVIAGFVLHNSGPRAIYVLSAVISGIIGCVAIVRRRTLRMIEHNPNSETAPAHA